MDNFKPREDDPRAGYGGLNFVDYSVPIGEPMVKRYIRRHRLEKKDPNAAISEPVKPIEYWVDSGAPDDVKKALVEGASWWNQAFEAAGFQNAFKVGGAARGRRPHGHPLQHDQLGAPLDARLELPAATVTDPRTGEIIKGTVTLGSLRDRQDYLIFEGLLSPYTTGNEKPEILYQTALARIRQLSAHEVGHTLGLGHNYYDSSQGWISVMDYPHPQEKLRADGTIDLSDAYPAAHRRMGQGHHQLRLSPASRRRRDSRRSTRILDDAWAKDLRYMTNQDLRRASEGRSVVERRESGRRAEPHHEDSPRRAEPAGRAYHPQRRAHGDHRGAAGSHLHVSPLFGGIGRVDGGGIDYIYGIRGDGRTPVKWESAANQRKALDALANTLKPSELTVPKQVLDAIPPRPPGFGRHRELFPRTTGDGFDPLSPATVASDVTIGFVLRAGPRRAHGGAARRGSRAAGPGRSDRSADQSDLRRSGRVAV